MIIVVAYAALTVYAWPALPGFLIVVVGSMLVTVGLYGSVVKRSNATRFLFGMKPLDVRAETASR